MWQRSFDQTIHGHVRFDKCGTRVRIDLKYISELTDVDDAFLDVRSCAVRRAMGYPERLFSSEIVLDGGGDLGDDSAMAVHEGIRKQYKTMKTEIETKTENRNATDTC